MPSRKNRNSGPPRPQTLNFTPKNYAKTKTGVVKNLGAGDSKLALNFLPAELALDAFDRVRDEVAWQTMQHMGTDVPRLISQQGSITAEHKPVYRHPADEQPATVTWTPFVERIARLASKRFGFEFNHALVQHYRSGEDHIGEHADKTLDIKHGAPIVGISLGASRTFTLKSKEKLAASTGPLQIQKISLPHNSAMVLGLDTNRVFTHQVGRDARSCGQRRPDENLFEGQRISITLRCVVTFVRLGDGRLFGQGAKCKTEADLDAATDAEIAALPTTAVGALFLTGDVATVDDQTGSNSTHRASIGALDSRPKEEEDSTKAKEAAHGLQARPCGTHTLITEQKEELRMLRRAFHEENKRTSFDWSGAYGEGFDVLGFRLAHEAAP